jgi:hypothetical protein
VDEDALPSDATEMSADQFVHPDLIQRELESLPFRAHGDGFEVWKDGAWSPILIKGMNLGVGIPGTNPGELAPSYDEYRLWFQMMTDAGFNVLRIYTLHFPRFYAALAAHNQLNSHRPLYVYHGIWLHEMEDTLDVFVETEPFDEEIENVIRAVHGELDIGHRYGRAYGKYDINVSNWIIGYIIGREVSPFEVSEANFFHSSETSFSGEAFEMLNVTPFEAWVAARLDKVVTFERAEFGVARPVSFSSWPTLDPLRHYTEADDSDEDAEQIDLSLLVAKDAPAGFFVSYHAYPYYPDFMSEQPEYTAVSDRHGPNSYLGYLKDLKSHYQGIPLVIGEFGTPTSWGNAHDSHSGMSHGGLNEAQSAFAAVRMFENIFEAGCAGGAYFAWFDEWWKRTWLTDMIDFPWDRRQLWPNVTAPEQNFGVLTFDLDPVDFSKGMSTTAAGTVSKIRHLTNAAGLHVRFDLGRPLAQGELATVGIDTLYSDIGEFILPGNHEGPLGYEFAVVVEGGSPRAQLYVTQAYDLVGIWHWTSDDTQLYHTVTTRGSPWNPVRWQNNRARSSADGLYVFPASYHDIGRLFVRPVDQPGTSMDAVFLTSIGFDLFLPWSLLQATDPSARLVMNDERGTVVREVAESDGIAVSLVMASDIVTTSKYLWEPWETVPPSTLREKEALHVLSEYLNSF